MVYIRAFQIMGCNPKWGQVKKFWCYETNSFLYFVPRNFENASSAAKLFEKNYGC